MALFVFYKCLFLGMIMYGFAIFLMHLSINMCIINFLLIYCINSNFNIVGNKNNDGLYISICFSITVYYHV